MIGVKATHEGEVRTEFAKESLPETQAPHFHTSSFCEPQHLPYAFQCHSDV